MSDSLPDGPLSLQRALAIIEKLQSRLEELKRGRKEPVAVIGMGCRFPGGADSPRRFWATLHAGVDAIGEIPPERWSIADYYDPDPEAPGKMTTRYGGFLPEVDRFDASFFRISPPEAASMDPQQRVLLEVAWEALEDAAIPSSRLSGSKTGVFVGITNNDYAKLQLRVGGMEAIDSYYASGGLLNVAAGRLSYLLGFEGPAIALDTACSSSLVAVHLACQSLRNQECSLALGCGVNLILSPDLNINLSKARLMAADGRCKTFDAAADGYVRGEGCGVVVLKLLSDARRDGDRILAVIRGSAVNSDGHCSGLTVPNGLAQQALIRAALADAGVTPGMIDYVEAHGTGTPLGDPIEVRALGAVLGQGREPGRRWGLGSVKTNIGHTESAAGIAGLTKVILSLTHQEIPPHLHFRTPNPDIALGQLSAFIPTAPTAWPRTERARLAGVSSFGFSGTNAHVIVEEAPPERAGAKGSERPSHLLTLSAKERPALTALCSRYSGHLRQDFSESLANLCFTANTGRSPFAHRIAIVASDLGELGQKLETCRADAYGAGCYYGYAPVSTSVKPVFLFTGQGSQYAGMARTLFATQPTFRSRMEMCNELLRSELPQPLLDVILGESSDAGLIDETGYTQPGLFALEYSLAELWRSWGIEPAVVLGHSLGEYVAACVAGVFSLEEGLRLVARRARLMQSLPRNGEMLVVFAEEKRALDAIAPWRDRVFLAAVNGPDHLVISGERNAVRAVSSRLEVEGIPTRGLRVSHAFHSPLMEPILPEFGRELSGVKFAPPRIKIITNLKGDFAGELDIGTSGYWLQQMLRPVQFQSGIQKLRESGAEVFLEIGPHPTLVGMAKRCVPENFGIWLASLRKGRNDWAEILDSAAQLYVKGASVDWVGFDRDYARRKIELPLYPFQRERHWIEGIASRSVAPAGPPRAQVPPEHPLLGSRWPTALDELIFQNQFGAASPPLLNDHRLHGRMVAPASAYISMVMSAAERTQGPPPFYARDLFFPQALVLADQGGTTVQLILKPGGSQDASFRLFSLPNRGTAGQGSWVLHASGTVKVSGEQADTRTSVAPLLPDIFDRCRAEMSGQDFYREYRQVGYNLGQAFQWIERIWRREGEALCRMRPPQAESETQPFSLHPGLLDSCLQVLCHSLPEGGARSLVSEGEVYIPLSIETFSYRRGPLPSLWCHATVLDGNATDSKVFTGEFCLFAETGEVVAEAKGVRLIRVSREALFRDDSSHDEDWLYRISWEAQPLASTSRSVPDSDEGQRVWLILGEGGGVGAGIHRVLEQQGCRAMLVPAGNEAASGNGNRGATNPPAVEDYERVLEGVAGKTGTGLAGILYLGCLDSPKVAKGASSPPAAALETCTKALRFLQSVARFRVADSRQGQMGRVWVVTRGAQPVGSTTRPLALTESPVWGLGRVAAAEYPDHWGGLVDLDPSARDVDLDCLGNEILADAGEDQVVFRDGQRFVARLERAQSYSPGGPQLRREATYLITGGWGGIGLKTAEFLADRGARNLVLVGRSAPGPAAREVLSGLEKRGVQVVCQAADVSRRDQTAAVLEQIHRELPELRGIVHAAGVLDDALLAEQTPEQLARVLAPKVGGAWNLHELTLGQPLDFFVLFSSFASLMGLPGQGNYAAANSFLDSLAHERRHLGLAALSINWGPWTGVGMTARANPEGPRRFRGIETLHPARGTAILGHLIARGETQMAVMPLHSGAWRETYPAAASAPLLSNLVDKSRLAARATESAPPSHRIDFAALLAADENDRERMVADEIVGVVSHVMGIPVSKLDARRPLAEFGLDSLLAFTLRSRIKSELGITLPIPLFLRGASVTQFAQEVLQQLLIATLTSAPSKSRTDDDWEEITL